MRCERPLVPKWIDDDAIAVAPEHVHRRHLDGGAGLLSPLDRGVAVFDIVVNAYRRAFQCYRRTRLAAAKFGEIVNEKQEALANADRRMHDPLAIRRRRAANFLGTECLLVELDGVGAGTAHQVRDQAFLAGGNWLDGLAHGETPREKVEGCRSDTNFRRLLNEMADRQAAAPPKFNDTAKG